MRTVAVTGAAGPIGRALLERLDADPVIERLIGIDVTEPPMPVAKLLFRAADVRDPQLASLIEGADAVVHLAVDDTPSRDEDESLARRVHGTRTVLGAVKEAGVPRFVHLSSASVYGAHPDNELPLGEQAPLRANPDYAPAYHHLLAEGLVTQFDKREPDTTVVVLRPAAVLADGADHLVTRHLEGPRLLMVRGLEPPMQVVHPDDVAAAVHHALTADLSGVYNVAADGWLLIDEVCAIVGKRTLEVPEAVAFSVTREVWQRGLGHQPPGGLHFLMYPWVVSARRLEQTGWAPSRSNREALREFAAARHAWVRLGAARVRRRDLRLAAVALAGVLAVAVRARRRRRR